MKGLRTSSSSSNSSENGHSPDLRKVKNHPMVGKGRATLRRFDNGNIYKISKSQAKPGQRGETRPGMVITNNKVATHEDSTAPNNNNEEELMETSQLRDVSAANLSAVLSVQEHEETEITRTEAELAKMGHSLFIFVTT